MLKVDNKKTIRLLAKSSFRSNKMRNLFAIVAIILTTVLFTGLFTVTSSLLSSMEASMMRQVGGNSHGTFKYLTMEQYDKLKKHPSIRDISYSVILGVAENKELEKRPSEIRYVSDEQGAKGLFSMPTTGRLPQKDDEIAVDTLVLKQLGISAKLGQKVTLEYSLNDVKHSGTFTLVGFWQGDILIPSSQIWLNQNYVKKQLKNYIPTDEYDYIGSISADVNFSNSFQIEHKLEKIITDSGFTLEEIVYGTNWAYIGNSPLNIGAILAVLGIILMIAFCGYLIISNVFYISIAKDIRFYGLLKSIGTTGKQIRTFIGIQAQLLCIIGIPIGLLFGYVIGGFITPSILSSLSTNVIEISVSPITFIASAVFALITVFISIAKPAKIAAKVTPIEALRSIDGVQKSKKSTKTNGKVKLLNMAFHNILRHKKKAIFVTLSLSLSLIILNCTYSIGNSFDMDQYLSHMITSDFALGDISNFNVQLDYDDQNTLNQDFLTELRSKKGIEKMCNIYFAEPLCATDPRLMHLSKKTAKELGVEEAFLADMNASLEDDFQTQHIYGLDEMAWDKLTLHEGTIDLEKLKTGNYVIVGTYFFDETVNYYNVGDKVTITNPNEISKEYEVLAIASIPFNISIKHSHPIALEFFLPSNIFLQDITQKAPMLTTFNVADVYEEDMESYLNDYCKNVDDNMQYASKATYAAEYENAQRTYQFVGTMLSLLVAFIGIMNFINTILTSILARKRELALLQSIGMTTPQIQKMLVLEGLIHIAFTAVFTLTIGSLLTYLFIGPSTGDGVYLSLHFTIIPSLLCLPLFAFFSALIPYLGERHMRKISIVERLREVE